MSGNSADVLPFETLHQPHTHPHGLVVKADSTQVAYSGDTGWFPELPGQVAGSDLFICECTYERNEFEYHLNHEDLVARKSEFDCGRLILTHLGAGMSERRGRCDFETADDGLVVKL